MSQKFKTNIIVDGTVTASSFIGAASDPTKLPLAGGTITGNLDVNGIIDNTRNNTNALPPSISDHTAGTRIKFWDSSDVFFYALGIENGHLWSNADVGFKWYQRAVEKMSLSNGNLTVAGTLSASGYNNSNWDTAYGWGDHDGLYAPTGYGIGGSSILGSGNDANLKTLTGFYYFASASNTPTTYFQAGILGSYNGDFAQYGIGSNQEMYFRWGYDSWKTIIHSGNISSQSVTFATNAGTLDSIDSSQFLRSDESDTMTGSLTVNASGIGLNVSSSQNTGLVIDGGTNSGVIADFKYGTRKAYINTSGNIYSSGLFDIDDTNYYVNPNSNSKLSNLGLGGVSPDVRLSVSGDTHVSGYVYQGGTAGSSGSWGSRTLVSGGAYTSNAYSFTFNNVGYGSNWAFGISSSGAVTTNRHIDANTVWTNDATTLFLGWYSGKTVIGNNNNSNHDNAAALGANTIAVTNPLYSFTNTQSPIFYDSNDTGYYVDPNSVSRVSQLRVTELSFIDGAGVWSNIIRSAAYPSESFPTGSNYWLEYRAKGGHHFVLNTDGGVGGGANSMDDFTIWQGDIDGNRLLEVTNTGNVTASADMRAPIFYDSNDTGYYVDAASTSNLNSLNVGGQAVITAGNIGSQSVNYAASAGAVYGNQNGSFGLNDTKLYLRTNGDNNHYLWNAADDWEELNAYEGTGLRITSVGGSTGILYVYGSSNGGYTYSPYSFRSPIFYDSNNTGYYLDPHATSNLNTVQANTIRNDGDVSSDDLFGIYWNDTASTAYGIFREGGAWSHPYPDLRIAFHTGIKLGANSGYNGIRFYTDYDMSAQVMSVNNGSDPLGGGHVYVNNTLQAGEGLRAPIFYDSNDTGYYVDPNGTSNTNDFRAAAYRGNANVGGTGTATWHPDGIFCGGTMWQYGDMYKNNTPIYNLSYLGMSGANTQPIVIEGASHKYLYITPGNGYEAMVRYNGGSGNTWYVGKRTANQLVGTGDFHFYSQEAGATVGGYTIGGDHYASGSSRSPIFYDSNDTSYYANLASATSLYINGGISQNNLVGRPYAVWGSTGTSGAVVIKFPGGTGNYGMIHAVIDIYEYSGDYGCSVIVSGHNWNGAWYNYGAQLIGRTNKQVRVGVKDGKYCIVIGDGSSGWSYGQVVLRKIQNGTYYQNVMNVSEGYTAGIESDSYSWISGDLRQLNITATISSTLDVRAPIFYDSDNTTFYANPGSTSRFRDLWVRGDNQYEGYVMIGGDSAGARLNINFDQMWTNVGNLHLQYSSSGNIDMNQGGGYTFSRTSLRAPIFYDYNDTSYYVDPNSTTRLYDMYVVGGVAGISNSSVYHEAALEIRERNFGGAQDDTWATAPRIGFHWSGRVASQIALSSAGWINIMNNPGNGFESFRAGAIYSTGDVTAYYSDIRLKDIQGPITNALNAVLSIDTFKYKHNEIAKENGFEGDDIQLGVSAQSVEAVFPELVKHAPFDIKHQDGIETSKTGEWYKTVKYERLVPVLIEAIKEQQKQIEELKAIVNGITK